MLSDNRLGLPAVALPRSLQRGGGEGTLYSIQVCKRAQRGPTAKSIAKCSSDCDCFPAVWRRRLGAFVSPHVERWEDCPCCHASIIEIGRVYNMCTTHVHGTHTIG